MLEVQDLKVEYRRSPIGLDAAAPRFSWKLRSGRQNVMQKSWRIVVSGPTGTVWDSGTVDSEDSIALRYAGEALAPCTEYDVSVTVTDNYDETAQASGSFETGLWSPKIGRPSGSPTALRIPWSRPRFS